MGLTDNSTAHWLILYVIHKYYLNYYDCYWFIWVWEEDTATQNNSSCTRIQCYNLIFICDVLMVMHSHYDNSK